MFFIKLIAMQMQIVPGLSPYIIRAIHNEIDLQVLLNNDQWMCTLIQ